MAFANELTAMIESGAGLVVGTVSADGEPRADRAWAAWVVDDDERRIRFVMSADAPTVMDNLRSGHVTLTGAEVSTFESVQCKGRPVVVETPSADDVDLVHRHSEVFFDAVHRSDGNAIEHLRRMLPHEMVSVEMIVTELFDQTPGPGAGTALVDERP